MRLTSDFGDPGRRPHGLDQVVDVSCRDPMDVGLHDDGIEGLIDATPGLEDGGEEAPTAQFGDGQLDVAGLGGEHPAAVPIAFVGTLLAAFIALRADQRGQLGLDQLLADETDRFSDQIEPFADWKAASSSDRTDWSRAIGVYSFGAFGQEHTEDHAAGRVTRSATVGTPSKRTPPPCGFGSSTARTGGGK